MPKFDNSPPCLTRQESPYQAWFTLSALLTACIVSIAVFGIRWNSLLISAVATCFFEWMMLLLARLSNPLLSLWVAARCKPAWGQTDLTLVFEIELKGFLGPTTTAEKIGQLRHPYDILQVKDCQSQCYNDPSDAEFLSPQCLGTYLDPFER